MNLQRLALPPGEKPPWSVGHAVAAVLASEAALIVVGSLLYVVLGYGDVTDAAKVPIWAQFVSTAPFWIAALLTTWLLVNRLGASPVESLGLQFKAIDVPVGLAIGVATQLLALPVLYWPIFKLTDTNSAKLEEAAEKLAETMGTSAWSAVLFLLMTIVCAPIAEETLFRGVLARGLRHYGRWASIIVSSVLFGAVHFQLLQLPGLILIGIVCAVGQQYTNRLSTAVFIHMGFNAVTAILLVIDQFK